MNRAFFDSNVLLYTVELDSVRSSRSAELIAAGGSVSVQCLNEFASVALGKLRRDWAFVHAALQRLGRAFDKVVPLTVDLYVRGLAFAERYRWSVYDAMIVAAALEAGCDTLWSEDMHDGLVVEGRLTIRNPFKG